MAVASLPRLVLACALPASGERPGLGDIDLAPFFAEFRRAAPWVLRFGFSTACFFFGYLAPTVLIGRFSTLRRLTDQDRDACFQRAIHHDVFVIRQMAYAVKLVAGFAAFADPRFREAFPC
jgi:hypothetical protein